MSIERGTEQRTLRRRVVREDAVAMVRQALEKAQTNRPLFSGEEQDGKAAAFVLEERLKHLKARGIEFGEIELSVYARQLLSGPGRMPMAS
jgi:hypothetical protein